MQIEMKKIVTLVLCLTSATLLAQSFKCYITPVENINTERNEYNTVFNTDYSKFTYTESKISKHGDSKEIVMSAAKENDEWTPKGKMLALGNKVSHIDIVEWITDDTVYVYKGRNSGKLYIYSFNGKKWKKSGKIKICKTRIKKCCLNSKGNILYFSTYDKKRGLGGQDIYACKKISGNKWDTPINLGPDVNSPSDDIAPFLAGDDMLFFSSDRDGGNGGFDIFLTKLDSGKWSKPVNLGEPINSSKDDAFLTMTNNERDAYLSSNRDGGKGGMDLYKITFILSKRLADALPQEKTLLSDKLLSDINLQKESHLDSTKITLLKGMIMGDDSVYLKAKVALSDNGLRQVIATQEAEDNGAYEVILPGGANYGIAVSYPGYLFHSENFDLPEQTEYKEIKKDIVLKRLAIGKNVALRNLFFETNKSDLNEASITELANVIQLLNDNPTLHIEIEGHTDNTGSKAYNQTLSEARAKSVVDYLVAHGIDAGRLTSKGYGFSKPVASNKTAEGRAENRRTELLVTKF